MGKAEEWGWFRCAGLREESLIWFEVQYWHLKSKDTADGGFRAFCQPFFLLRMYVFNHFQPGFTNSRLIDEILKMNY